jgi:hypothetical protein
MALVDDLKAAKERFHAYSSNSIYASFVGATQGSPTALDALVLLRESLPKPFKDFREFEASRSWRRKDAYRTFDRAIERAQEAAK